MSNLRNAHVALSILRVKDPIVADLFLRWYDKSELTISEKNVAFIYDIIDMGRSLRDLCGNVY